MAEVKLKTIRAGNPSDVSSKEADAISSSSHDNEESNEETDEEVSDDLADSDREIKKLELSTTEPNLSLNFICDTLCDFDGRQPGDLCFVKGEKLTITELRKDGWWMAENSEGQRGTVPSTFLKVPAKITKLLESIQLSENVDKPLFWNHLRSNIRQMQVIDTALHGFGALPVGFSHSYLAELLHKDNKYSTGIFLKPKLNESGLSFVDLHWDKSSNNLKSEMASLQKIIRMIAFRQIIQPPNEYRITSRHVRMCLHDGNKVIGNIHTVSAKWVSTSPKIWAFTTKATSDSSCMEEGNIFIRSNKSNATLGVLFELCVSYIKQPSGEAGEMSCGWVFMRLLNDSGVPVTNRTKVLKVQNGTPFSSSEAHSSIPAGIGVLKNFRNRNKFPRMVISLSNPKQATADDMGFLPATMIGPVSTISIVALYRKIIANDIFEERTFDSIELIQSPFMATFAEIFNQPDLLDIFMRLWIERLKNDKTNSFKKEQNKKEAFGSLFTETIFVLLSSCTLPSFTLDDVKQERKAEISKFMTMVHERQPEAILLSTDLKFKPISVTQLACNFIQ